MGATVGVGRESRARGHRRGGLSLLVSRQPVHRLLRLGQTQTHRGGRRHDGPRRLWAAAGGTPVPLTTLDATRGENSHRWPEFLPDGRRLLYFARSADPQQAGMFLTSLDHPEIRKLILQTRESASYADTSQPAGHLLWTRGDDLLAQAFDARSATLEGKVSVVVHGPFAGLGGSERRLFSAATDGTLAVQRAEAQTTQLTWYGRDGRITGTAGRPSQ